MRVIGVDLGSKRVGLAVSTGSLATPLRVIERTDDERDAQTVAGIAANEGAERVVVGHPLRMDGSRGDAAEGAERFAGALRARGVDVVLWDERLTTTEAERALSEAGVRGRRRRVVIDSHAASVILQAWLDATAS